eukprot:CAMPEP_0172810514 /NCGR_PEP_ID=MMETSP1075-20121228/8849_1 /TAXON_ID=2916 /ORGANISM="Ceratium fusus, Strain PA161109" /LENGTH=320 /DNA_ID=CAMNT_0013649837 /DNA_START=39 /DNA_END=1001 /DNA_ORIENTATION=+
MAVDAMAPVQVGPRALASVTVPVRQRQHQCWHQPSYHHHQNQQQHQHHLHHQLQLPVTVPANLALQHGNAANRTATRSTRTVIYPATMHAFISKIGPDADFESIEDSFLPPVDMWGEPYKAMLDFVAQLGVLEGLPLDRSGILRVSVPFCAAFMECQILLPFLAQHFLERRLAQGLYVLGTDATILKGAKWPQKEKYAQRKFSRCQLHLRQMDLTKNSLPECALTVAVHPEATRDPVWEDIIANLIRSTVPGGVVLVATYFDVEVHAVQRYGAPLGVQFQVFENPYYASHSVEESPSLRFLLVARIGRKQPLPPVASILR